MRIALRVTASLLVIFFAGLLAGDIVSAQVPDKATNLKFYPPGTSVAELVQTMRGFSFSLGVRCQYCHAAKEGGTAEQLDFASDAKPAKVTARAMLEMADAINKDYIAKLGGSAPIKVECVTCHHGVAQPRTMDAVLRETIETKDVNAAVAQYRELRQKHLGDGAYDFSETRLNVLTESLLRQKKGKEAAAIMELNLETNTPPSTWALHLAGQAHILNNEPEKAKAEYEKILQINPQDQFAKKQLDSLNGKGKQ